MSFSDFVVADPSRFTLTPDTLELLADITRMQREESDKRSAKNIGKRTLPRESDTFGNSRTESEFTEGAKRIANYGSKLDLTNSEHACIVIRSLMTRKGNGTRSGGYLTRVWKANANDSWQYRIAKDSYRTEHGFDPTGKTAKDMRDATKRSGNVQFHPREWSDIVASAQCLYLTSLARETPDMREFFYRESKEVEGYSTLMSMIVRACIGAIVYHARGRIRGQQLVETACLKYGYGLDAEKRSESVRHRDGGRVTIEELTPIRGANDIFTPDRCTLEQRELSAKLHASIREFGERKGGCVYDIVYGVFVGDKSYRTLHAEHGVSLGTIAKLVDEYREFAREFLADDIGNWESIDNVDKRIDKAA